MTTLTFQQLSPKTDLSAMNTAQRMTNEQLAEYLTRGEGLDLLMMRAVRREAARRLIALTRIGPIE